jgi:hypothetical protein
MQIDYSFNAIKEMQVKGFVFQSLLIRLCLEEKKELADGSCQKTKELGLLLVDIRTGHPS